MYPSGAWRGFWQQEGWGRQPMEQFELSFTETIVRGRGIDILGPFIFRGQYDANTGSIAMIKQYIGKHAVAYRGQPDGEGSILGTWSIDREVYGIAYHGPFLMQPVKRVETQNLPIHDL